MRHENITRWNYERGKRSFALAQGFFLILNYSTRHRVEFPLSIQTDTSRELSLYILYYFLNLVRKRTLIDFWNGESAMVKDLGPLLWVFLEWFIQIFELNCCLLTSPDPMFYRHHIQSFDTSAWQHKSVCQKAKIVKQYVLFPFMHTDRCGTFQGRSVWPPYNHNT